MNIEHEFYELTGSYEAFEGLCFVDTLDLKESIHASLKGLFSDANTKRVQREYSSPITIVIGNPPYNAWQLNENDANKNRTYRRASKADLPGVDDLVSLTYAKDSQATNKNALSDPYVKFFRWATDRLRDRDGIVCFVSNNSFVENLAFDGMRKHLWKDFDRIYHLDLRGNVRQNPKLSGTAYNVFGIQVGVGITLAIRKESYTTKEIWFSQLELDQRRSEKLKEIAGATSIEGIAWHVLKAEDKVDFVATRNRPLAKKRDESMWITQANADIFTRQIAIGSREQKANDGVPSHVVFKIYGGGVKTCRDTQVYDFSAINLKEKIRYLIETYNLEVLRWQRILLKPTNKDEFRSLIDDFAGKTRDHIQWSESLKNSLVREHEILLDCQKVRRALYRPFVSKSIYFDRQVIERVYQFPAMVPSLESERENRLIVISDVAYRSPHFSVLISDRIVDLHACASLDSHQCFPFYVYDEDGTNRRENITDWALEVFRSHYGPRRLPVEPETLIRPSGTFSQGEKDDHLSPRERSDAQRTGEGPAVLPQFGSTSHRKAKVALDPELLAFARKLRQEQTEPEQWLWSLVRNQRLGAKFRRQHPIAPYVLDFYCHEARLAVELDGGQHSTDEGRKKDETRSQFLADKGIQVLRFWNHELVEETETVLEAIVLVLDRRLKMPQKETPLTKVSQVSIGEKTSANAMLRLISKWDIF